MSGLIVCYALWVWLWLAILGWFVWLSWCRPSGCVGFAVRGWVGVGVFDASGCLWNLAFWISAVGCLWVEFGCLILGFVWVW